MATEARKFQLGMFLIVATVIGVGALIWLGASRFFEKTEYLVTYLSESVQGLEPGSAVKYRGVPAGRVERIQIAPDGDLIEVVMSVNTEFARRVEKDPNLRAQIELAGITGLRYVEIDRHSGEALRDHPTLRFETHHPVIPSVPSSFKAVESAMEDIYKRVMAVDFAAISNDIHNTLESANTLLRDERVQQILTSLKNVSHSGDRVTQNLERITGELQLGPAVTNLTEATAQAKALFSDLQSGPSGTQLRNTLTAIERAAETTQEVVAGLQYTVQRIDRTVDSFERLSDEVRAQPSRLLFSEPPAPRRVGDGRDQ
jgi:phospholipid/cholesterol/gamma-HCH transport system substrate-binding protein